MVDPEANPVGACNAAADDATYDHKHIFASPNNQGEPHWTNWQTCRRIGHGAYGNYHVNNPDGIMRLTTEFDLADPNRSPIVYCNPIEFCFAETVCKLQVEAQEPDDERMEYRFAKQNEVAGPGSFHQPGVSCGKCSPVENDLTVDPYSV